MSSEPGGDAPCPVAFLGGKGGVGKTTVAAAYAQLLAGRGHRTLVVSTDPAHSLGDVFAEELGAEPRRLGEQLWASELDGHSAAQRRVREVTEQAREAVPREVIPAVERHLQRAAQSPGTVESALVDQLAELLDAVGQRWDRVVVDSAPTGHMLRMLSLPSLLTPWIEGLVRQRERVRGTERLLSGLLGDREQGEDPLLQRLRDRRTRLQRVREQLLQRCLVHMVLVPERLPLAETERAVGELAEAGIRLGAVVINRVVPDDATSTDEGVLRKRRAHQEELLPGIRQRWREYGMAEIPLLGTELVGRAAVNDVAGYLAAAGW